MQMVLVRAAASWIDGLTDTSELRPLTGVADEPTNVEMRESCPRQISSLGRVGSDYELS